MNLSPASVCNSTVAYVHIKEKFLNDPCSYGRRFRYSFVALVTDGKKRTVAISGCRRMNLSPASVCNSTVAYVHIKEKFLNDPCSYGRRFRYSFVALVTDGISKAVFVVRL